MPKKSGGPGPGQYDVPESFGRRDARSCSLHSRSRMPMQEPLPGPADYTSLDVSFRKSQPRCLMPRSSRGAQWLRTATDGGPGPAEYSPKNPSFISAAKSIGEKLPREVVTLTPGPGTYTPRGERRSCSSNFAKRTGRVLPTARFLQTPMGYDTPGPAAYQFDSKETGRHGPKIGFGSCPRITGFETQGARTPGPGAYSWELKPYGPRISMAARIESDM